MADLRISAEARRDLRDIRDTGLETVGWEHATRYLNGFDRLFRLLRDQPHAGQLRAEIEPGLRSFSYRPYRILYAIRDDAVVIVRIIHQARDMRSAMQEDH